MTDRIIVPLDGSPLSHGALPLARGLALKIGAPVTLVAVVDPPHGFFESWRGQDTSRMSASDFDRLTAETTRQEKYLENIGITFDVAAIDHTVQIGRAADKILDVASWYSDPVIVMASHGRSGLGLALTGSVAFRVVQGARCPVFIVRSSEVSKNEYGTKEINQVLVPLDGSLLAERSLAAVDRLFGNDVNVTLVRFVEPIGPGQAYAAEMIAEYEDRDRTNAQEYLQKISEQLSDEGKTVAWQTVAGPPGEGINDLAQQLDVDLIAMTTHGRSGLGRFFLGSVVERVLHNAEHPLLIVRASESGEREIDADDPLVI